jgi:hypothetical protein
MKYKPIIVIGLLIWGVLAVFQVASAQENASSVVSINLHALSLEKATMCEGIKEYEPVNQSVAFSLEIGKIYCFTAFDIVPSKTMIYHHWYRNDRLVTSKRLTLKTPKWSTFSSIQLREADKGPWRVEIQDKNKETLKTLRFSVTD